MPIGLLNVRADDLVPLDEQNASKAKITAEWDKVVGANVK